MSVILNARGLNKAFGAVTAAKDVNAAIEQDSVVGLIGTNGAGKTTFINMITGYLKPDAGTIEYEGRDITPLPPREITRRGICRSFQIPQLYSSLSVLENCRLAAQARFQSPWRVWESAALCARCMEAARAAVERAGLAHAIDRPAELLSHGEKRQLEIAVCLATSPQVLLLDEPLAGMGAEETERMLALLGGLRAAHAILLVEHDMDAVFRIADRITVLVDGRTIASGTPAEVRANAEVQNAYLGHA